MLYKKHSILSFILSLLLSITLWSEPTQTTGWLIHLDGTSSAGKSSVARHLKEKLKKQTNLNFIYDSLDLFNDRKYAEEERLAKQKEQESQKIAQSKNIQTTARSDESADDDDDNDDNEALEKSATKSEEEIDEEGYSDDDENQEEYLNYIKSQIATGKNIISDSVLIDERDQKNFQSIIGKDNKIICAMVYCPVKELTRRIEARNISGNRDEERTYYQAVAQIPDMFTLTSKRTDETIDSMTKHDVEEMLKPVKKELEEDNKKKRAKGKKEDNVPQIMQSLRSDLIPKKGNTSYIQPKIDHDVIAVNSRKNGPAIAAQKIADVVVNRMFKGKICPIKTKHRARKRSLDMRPALV